MTSVMEWQHDGRTLEIETDRIEVSKVRPQPDPKWTYTDHAGHPHAYGTDGTAADRYPTLVLWTSEPYWCSDCDDEHTDSWFECPLCGEKITPGTFIDTSPRHVSGRTAYLIDGHPVPEREGQALLADIQAASAERQRAQELTEAQTKASAAAQAMRDEGLDEQQIQRVVNRLVHGHPDGAQS